jgi:thioredoxin reductase
VGLAQDLSAKHGYHFQMQMQNPNGKDGVRWHLEHNGESLKLIHREPSEENFDHRLNQKILVVGGGHSAVEAAMGLASQVENSVTISYRQAAFSPIKDRNKQRIDEFIRKGKLKALFNSNPVEILADSVIIYVHGAKRTIANDFVWIFAGGEPPTAVLKKVGVGFGERDVTPDGARAIKEA